MKIPYFMNILLQQNVKDGIKPCNKHKDDQKGFSRIYIQSA